MSDYKALIEEAALSDDPELIDRLAEAAEALAADNAVYQRVQDHRDRLQVENVKLTAERDALRAQLDAMTTEWGTFDRDEWSGEEWHRPAADEETARRSLEHSLYSRHLAKRLVGPWVEVTD